MKVEIKQGQSNHIDKETESDLMDVLRKIIAIRKTIYKAAGIGLVIGVIIAQFVFQSNIQLKSPFLRRWVAIRVVVYLVWQLLFREVDVAMEMVLMLLNASLSADIVSSTPFY